MSGLIEAGIVRAAASAARFIAPRVAEKRRHAKLAEEVRPLLAHHDALELVATLTDQQRASLVRYFDSPQFERIALTMMTAAYSGSNETDLLGVREELRLGLAHSVSSNADQLFEITEVAFDILLTAAHTVQATYRLPPSGHISTILLATTAKLAAASARNCELLARSEDLPAFEEFCSTLRAQVKAAYGTMRLPHAGLNRAVPYSRIFVQPDITKDRVTAGDKGKARPHRTSISKLISTQLRFVLLGAPGAGKSTSANKLAFDIATNKIRTLADRTPFLVQLRDHTENLKSMPETTILDLIKASCNRPHHVFPTTEQIEYALLGGRAVLILDGVDELGDSSLRARLAQLVEGFASRYPLTQMMVTSREVGYFEAALNDGLFPVFRVAPFREEQVASYVNKWFQASTASYQLSPKELSSAFLQESNETVPDLRTNPLLLSLLCGMYASTQYLPRNRPEVYEKCAEMLFERWDRSRGVHVPLRFAADIRPAVQQLAWLLLTDNKGRVALPRSEILRFLKDYLQNKRYEDEDQALQAAQEFIDFCAGRAWALSEVGSSSAEPLYGFTHRTFLEYFAASRIVRHAPNADAIWKLLGNKVLDSSWREVAHLAMQILDRTVEDQAGRLLDLLLNDLPAEMTPRAEYLQFCVTSLGAVHPSPATFRRIVEETTRNTCFTSIENRCRVVFETEQLSGMFAADATLTALIKNRHDYREKSHRLVSERLISITHEAPWHSNPASLLLSKMIPGHQMADVGVHDNYVSEVEQLCLPWLKLNSGACPPDVERLDVRHYLGHPLFFSTLALSPLETLIAHGIEDSLSPSSGLLAEHMERTLVAAGRPWEQISYVAVDRQVNRAQLRLLPMLALGTGVRRADRHGLSALDEGMLSTLPQVLRGAAIIGMLPRIEAASQALSEADEAAWPTFGSSLADKLILARASGLRPHLDVADAALERLHLSMKAREFATAWLGGEISLVEVTRREYEGKFRQKEG